MRTARITYSTLIIAWVGAALAAPVFGQIQLTQASYMGEVVGVRGLEIYVKANNGAAIIASLDPKREINGMRVTQMAEPQIEVVGEIRGEHLAKGMAVRFRAKVQGQTRRRTVEPVNKLEVFTPEQATQFGLISEGAGGADAKPGEADAIRDYLVVGVITAIRGGTVTVEFPRSELKGGVTATLAADAVVDVKVSQLIAPPGAQITVEGVQILGVEVQPIKVLVTKVQVQLPPPPPPKNKVVRGQGKPDEPPAEAAGPLAGKEADGGAKPEAEKAEQATIPGEIIKLN